MIKNALQEIGAAPLLTIAVLLLFLGVFVGTAWFAWRMSRAHAEKMGNLPLEDESTTPKG